MDVPPKGDPDHPLTALGPTIRRLPRYLRLGRALVTDRALSRRRKAALAAGLAYLASPVDLVPGLIPVLGQLDDLAAVLLACRYALRGLPAPAAAAHLGAAGLTTTDLDRDLAAVKSAAAWTVESAARTSWRAAWLAARTAARVGATSARAGLRAVRGRSRFRAGPVRPTDGRT